MNVLAQIVATVVVTMMMVVCSSSGGTRASSYTDSSNNLLLDELTKSCPSDGIPVCGIRQKQLFLFPNGCLLQEVNKDMQLHETSFKKIPLKYCMYGCQFSCAKIYKPICVRNMRTYAKQMFVNQCELTKYVCQTNVEYLKISLTECQPPRYIRNSNKSLEKRSQAPKRKRKPIPCTNVFKSVCGSYMGVKSSFRNECLLNAENVKFNRDWRIIRNGMCAEDYSNARERKEKPTKPHSIKKRSYQNSLYNQYPDEHEFNTNNFVDYKNQPNLSPNGLYVYMPPAFQAQFLNHDSPGYQHPIPVHKAYDEILNKIISLPPSTDIPVREVETDEETHKLEDPIFEESVIKPLAFATDRVNFNYMTDRNFAHDINRQSVPLAINTFTDEDNKEYYYDFERVNPDFDNEEIATTISTTITTSTETTQMPNRLSTTTSRPKVLRKPKQQKNEMTPVNIVDCKFGSTSICGMLADGTVRTFDTICEMMAANVYLKNTWTKLHEGVCEDCKYNCSRDYQPVCVTRNGVNYTMVNDCYYNMGICMDKKSKWDKLSDGECERYTRIPDKYANSKPGFPYTSSYFVSETTPMPSTDTMPLVITSKPLRLKYRKSNKRKFNPKRAVSRRSSSNRCCSRSHFSNEFAHDNIKCKCWSDASTQIPSTRLSLYGPQTESYIMRLVKDNDERAMVY
ncbi:uncharacterized protein LOC135953216 [Calliphora vicina]|uniref:uncharacterized protein LOC135953216 n=1 Tax=Calliphora vicina TaxID=7373 RepID=UPI00325AC223